MRTCSLLAAARLQKEQKLLASQSTLSEQVLGELQLFIFFDSY